MLAPQLGFEPTTLRLTPNVSSATQNAATYYIFYYSDPFTELVSVSKLLETLEAAIGIEPMNKGFAVSPGSFSQFR